MFCLMDMLRNILYNIFSIFYKRIQNFRLDQWVLSTQTSTRESAGVCALIITNIQLFFKCIFFYRVVKCASRRYNMLRHKKSVIIGRKYLRSEIAYHVPCS